MRRTKIFSILIAMIICFSTGVFANNHIEKQSYVESEEDIVIKELYLKYTNADNIEFVSKEQNVFYFRVYPEHANLNYFIVEYDKTKKDKKDQIREFEWIWAKKYEAEIIKIKFEDLETQKKLAKVYLSNGDILEEKEIFEDHKNMNSMSYHFILKNNSF